MQGIFQKENTDKALKYGIYRHLPTYEKIIRNLVSFSMKKSMIYRVLIYIAGLLILAMESNHFTKEKLTALAGIEE